MKDQKQQQLPVITLLERTYGELHDMVSDMIEGGRLTETDIPDDYEALVNKLSYCNAHSPRIVNVVKAHVGLVLAVNKLLDLMDDAMNGGYCLTDEETAARDYARLQLEALEPPSQDDQQRLSAGLHSACSYINSDRDLHARHDKYDTWRLDPGKLQTALEQAGLRVLA